MKKEPAKKLAMIVISVALAIGRLTAQERSATESAFVEAAQLFQRASGGDAKVLENAVAAFETLTRTDPDSPLYSAYLGSAKCMRARGAWAPWNKVKYCEQGLDDVDRALRLLRPEHDGQRMRGTPIGLETRIVVARTFLTVPDGIFHRRSAGKKLIAEVLAHPDFATAPALLRASVYFAAAQAARGENRDEEIEQLKQVLALAPSSNLANQAHARLKELGP